MTILENLNNDENKAIGELRVRFKNVLSSEIYNDYTFFYRFLKARDFDVAKAETLLRENLAWRKSFQVDNFLEIFQPTEVFEKFSPINFIGFDKEGNYVNYVPCGKIDGRDLAKCVKLNDIEKHYIWYTERNLQLLNKENERTGRTAYRGILIFDLDCVSIGNLTSKAAADQLLRLTILLQDNYPENMKSVYVINAGWKEALRKVIDLDVLPAFLGGNRTDPDGNPSCKTIVKFGGKIPPRYFLSPEERTFKDKNRVRKIYVSSGSSVKVSEEVQDLGSHIQCEFEVKSKDIGFGLFFQSSENQLEEVFPIQRFVTADGTETVSFKSQTIGTYVIIFDNSHSWFTSKEVHYCITVQKTQF